MLSEEANGSRFRTNKAIWLLIDALCWIVSAPLALFIRLEGELSIELLKKALLLGLFLSIISVLLTLLAARVYSSTQELNFEKIILLTSIAAFNSFLFTLLIHFGFLASLPRSIPVITTMISILLQFGVRFQHKLFLVFRTKNSPNSESVLIYGAGTAGRQVAEQMLNNSERFQLMGFLDDDLRLLNTRIFGRKVHATSENLEDTLIRLQPRIFIIAISRINRQSILDIKAICESLGIKISIIPSAHKLISGKIDIDDLVNIDYRELLDRNEFQSQFDLLEKFFQNRKILVTGAAGTIGSEIARQLAVIPNTRVFLLDRDENGLLNTIQDIDPSSSLMDDRVQLCDIRDREKLNQIISNIKPDVVFHAAALKHVASLERFPEEAWRTNYEGTKNIVDSAIENCIPFFVNISTDKAANPSTVLGKTKLEAEKMISERAMLLNPNFKYVSVRFGNVIGSNGSFVTIFVKQIQKGGPITVRHPDVTRYFMTITEAVSLVLEGLIVGNNGETLILDMGEPVKILDVAKKLIKLDGREIQIVFTGLNPGEKLHEQLVAENEKVHPGDNPKILHTNVARK